MTGHIRLRYVDRMGFLKGAGEVMWLAEITFPSGNRIKSGISNLRTAVYFASIGCNVFVTFSPSSLLPVNYLKLEYRKEWEN